MGCEPRGFGWSATVEVCSARVTRLVTGPGKLRKISSASPGAWHRVRGLDLPAFRFRDRKGARHRVSSPRQGSQRCLAPGAGTRFASIPIQASQRCLAPGAGTRFASIPIQASQRCLAPGAGARFASIPIRDRKGAWHRVRGLDLLAFRVGLAVADRTDRTDQRRKRAVPQVKPAPKPHRSASLPFCSLP
jgi:hypothetical protein